MMSFIGILTTVTVLLNKTVCAFEHLHKSKYGVTINFVINLKHMCQSEEERFASLHGLSVAQCVQECGLRKHCVALNFKRRFNICELLTSGGNDVMRRTAGCIHVRASDIEIIQEPCGDCAYGESCDTLSKQCRYKECLTTAENVEVLGNINNIGAMITYKCKHGYTNINDVLNAYCRNSGQWSSTANCTTGCGAPPSIEHGTVVIDSSMENIATVTCESSYQASTNVITCSAAGIWETATCTDCYTSNSWEYAGKLNVTETGSPCLRWDSQTMYTNLNDFPESTLSEAENYCRNPNRFIGAPWCLTSLIRSGNWWGYCDIPRCYL